MQISILGCGWLGLPLAKALVAKSFTVKGSTTTPEKIAVLKEAGIDPYIIDLTNYSPALGTEFSKGSEILIINIPPKLRAGGTENYPAKINMIIPEAEKAGITKVLFVSSTSVYSDDNAIVTEDTPLNPDSESGGQIVEAEQLLQNNTQFKTTILRFGGLIGAGRNPAKFLAGKENVANPAAPVNLIQLEDCIGIILKIIENDVWGETFNAASPQHPSRKDYYTKAAETLGLTPPKFNYDTPSVGKTIVPNKILTLLDYKFTTPI